MKKISIILGSALMMLTGCTTDITKEVATNDNKVVIDLSADATRTSLGDKNADSAYPVLWSAGDKIAVNGIASEPLAAEYDGKTHAQFTVTGVAAPYNVLYPAEVLQPDGSVKISEIQEYVAGSFAQGAAVMAGHYDTPEGEIKNLYGFIKVTILKGDADKIIKSITLHSNNLEAMTGTFTIDYVNAALEPLSGMDFVKVTAADGIPFVDGKAEVVIAVPAGTYAKGFSIIITSTDGMTTKKSAYPNGATIAASTLLEMPDITFNPTKTITEITDAAQLQAFLDAASAGAYDIFKNANGEVLLGSDIDMTGVTLTSATQFDGVFNGQGYAIKNWKSDGVALFAANSGTIKNVVLDESCELNLPTEIGGDFGFIVSTNNNMVSGCTNNADVKLLNGSFSAAANIGILVGYSPDAHIQNCINNGDLQISATGNAAGTCYIGTVQGRLAAKDADTEISNCINNGNISITITDDTTSKNFYIGGVTGSSNSGTKTTGCINHGDITFTTESSGAAVIIGGVTSYSAQAITDCFNSGAITLISKTQIKGTLIGGIAGYQHGAIKGCENTGNIELSAANFQGRNNIGDLTDTNGTSSAANGMGGIIGQSTASFSMDNCKNSGNIKAYYSDMASTMSNLSSKCRFVYGGLVGDAWGDISNSDNAGSLNIVMTSEGGTFTGASAGMTIYSGGIVGSGYYSLNQTELNITNCHNSADIYMRSDNTHATNHACGGIVGWPGKESGCTAVTKDCSNTGNVTVEGNIKARVGGIQGGSGRVENSINEGTITANCADASVIGGIAGFHSSSYQMTNCENYGDIVSPKAGIYAAGFIGQFGNATNSATTGCKINCKVQGVEGGCVGMLVGSFNGTTKVISIGSESAPCEVAGTLTVGGVSTVITDAELTKEYMFGAGANRDTNHNLFVTLLQ